MFSGAVKIGDLNDFIAPSQACVVSLEGGKLTATEDAEVRGGLQARRRMLAARAEAAARSVSGNQLRHAPEIICLGRRRLACSTPAAAAACRSPPLGFAFLLPCL